MRPSVADALTGLEGRIYDVGGWRLFCERGKMTGPTFTQSVNPVDDPDLELPMPPASAILFRMEPGPQRIVYAHHGALGRLAGASPTSPVGADFLRSIGAVAEPRNPDVFFDPGARRVARWLRRIGIESLSVRDGVLPRVQTPDGLVPDTSRTWEAKLPTSAAGVLRAFDEARHQSPWLILWSPISDLSGDHAINVLRRRLPVWGADYDEIMIILGDDGGSYVHWTRE